MCPSLSGIENENAGSNIVLRNWGIENIVLIGNLICHSQKPEVVNDGIKIK